MKLSVSVFLFMVGFCAASAQSTEEVTTAAPSVNDGEATTPGVKDGEIPDFQVIPNGYAGRTTTSRFWDCCKPTCGWVGNIGSRIGPVHSCTKDGNFRANSNTQSACEGGSSYICNNQQSIIKSPRLAYGFAAAAFQNPPENMCCTCFLLTFQKGPYGDCSGKQMVVQITNTGGSRSAAANFTNIELNIAGGGVGKYTTGCSSQWNAPGTGWGAQYGGVESEAACNQLPGPLQAGCKFRWTFLNGCSNPPATFQQVTCPQEIVNISGCSMGVRAEAN